MTAPILLGDGLETRDLFAGYPSGLATLGATVDGADALMLVSTFMVGVSHDPPLCSVAIQKSSNTWPILSRAPIIGVSALSAAHAGAVGRLGSRNHDGRLASVPLSHADSGALLVDDSVAWFECAPVQEMDAGDHLVVLLALLAGGRTDAAAPLILHRRDWHTTASIPPEL